MRTSPLYEKMSGGKEHELVAGSFEHAGTAVSHFKENENGGGDEGAVPSRASTSLEHWEAQSVDKAAVHPSSLHVFEEDDDRGLSRAFRLSIIVGSALVMLAVILCLVLVLPRSSRKSPTHGNSSKIISWQKHPHLFSSTVMLNHQHHNAHSPHPQHKPVKQKFSDHASTTLSLIISACKATLFPNECQASLGSDNSSIVATSADSLVSSSIVLARTEIMSLRLRSQDLLQASHNINLTTAAEECVYLLGRAASFLDKSKATAFNQQLPWQVADAQAWTSAALTYVNDCRSALSYVNTTSTIGNVMSQLSHAIMITSNALSMLDAYRAFRNNITLWSPPTKLTVFEAVEPPPEDVSGDWWTKPALTVSLDGSGDYSTVQAAVDAAPEGAVTWFVIHVRAGVYHERVNIPSTKTRLALIGDGMGKTVITGDYNAQMQGVTTYDSATVAIDGDRFVAVGMTFENTAGPEKHQAVALRVDSDFAAFYNCSFQAFQDTLYVHSLRQFFKNCQIEGTVDFIFGNAASFFQDCTILFRPGLPNVGTSVVTAQGRTDPGETSALVFHKCNLNGTPTFLQQTPMKHKSYLGRPWKTFSRTIFLECEMGGFFQPEGWLAWNGSPDVEGVLYGEYLSSGPGGQPSERVPWSTQLSHDMALFFTIAPFIQGDRWLPSTNIPYSLSL
ncbi:hypothetical protein KP509_34G021900 [Ceratopteris richardii]|uniref:Pectinesterase n=1 Tax=Ceratopteris richardii TaxID=49495 RepID=A0A8T2QJH5_CERRI|nr:hypothetical protein KP509_34G021900 [Ceratopteris richardii]